MTLYNAAHHAHRRMKHIERTSYILIGLGVAASVGFVFLVEPEQRTLINVLSVLGSVASLFGIAIAVLQTWSARLTAEDTRKIASDTRSEVRIRFANAEVAKAMPLIREIQAYLQSQKVEPALIRYRELKEVLIQFGNDDVLSELNRSLRDDQLIREIDVRIEALSDALLRNTELDFGDMLRQMEGLSNILARFEQKLQNKSLQQ